MNLPLFNESTGFTILLIYGLVAFALTYWYSRGYADNKTSFLVARRELGTLPYTLSGTVIAIFGSAVLVLAISKWKQNQNS